MERSLKTIVIVASAAAKWFIEERDTDKADLLEAATLGGDWDIPGPS